MIHAKIAVHDLMTMSFIVQSLESMCKQPEIITELFFLLSAYYSTGDGSLCKYTVRVDFQLLMHEFQTLDTETTES